MERAEFIPAALEKAISDKLKQDLTWSLFALVVDLTFIIDGGMKQAQIKQAIADFKDRYGPEFQHLWVLWKDKVF